MRYYAPAKKCKLDSAWIGPYLIVSFMGWTIGIQKDPDSPIVMVHCQDAKKIPAPTGAVSWLTSKESSIKPSVIVLGASTMHITVPSSLSTRPLDENHPTSDLSIFPRYHLTYDKPLRPEMYDTPSLPIMYDKPKMSHYPLQHKVL